MNLFNLFIQSIMGIIIASILVIMTIILIQRRRAKKWVKSVINKERQSYKQCPYCTALISHDSKYCPNCGKEL